MQLPFRLPADKPFDVVGLGLNSVDHLCVVPSYPSFDSKVEMVQYSCQPGGQVATALVALQRWGARTSYIGSFGDDHLGQLSRRSLEEEGVDVSRSVVKAHARNQTAVILVDQTSGERTVVWDREEALTLRPEQLGREAICAGRILHVDGYDREAALQAARWAREEGIPSVIDLDSPRGDAAELLRLIDAIIVPLDFCTQFTGQTDPEKALRRLAACGCAVAAITMGKKGAMALAGGEIFYSAAFPIPCVDTTGAGDVFHAGFIFAMLQGWDVEEALRFANAAAGLKCAHLGGRPGIPAAEKVKSLADIRR